MRTPPRLDVLLATPEQRRLYKDSATFYAAVRVLHDTLHDAAPVDGIRAVVDALADGCAAIEREGARTVWILERYSVSAAEAARLSALPNLTPNPAEVRLLTLAVPTDGRPPYFADRASDADTVAGLRAEVDRLRHELDEAQLRSIEARNPGIDLDDVRRHRAAP